MYYISKSFEIAGAHRLHLQYESKCNNLHGHNWTITIYCKAEQLENGMVQDFTVIKQKISKRLDHRFINDIIENPTAENIAKWICEQVDKCYKVRVVESEGNEAIYEI